MPAETTIYFDRQVDAIRPHVAAVVESLMQAESDRIEDDLALAISLQDCDRIDHIIIVDDRRVLGAWTRTVASSWPDPI